MQSTSDFTTVVDMPPGKHTIKFIVDDEWKCSDSLPTAEGDDGNPVNYIVVVDEEGSLVGDGLDTINQESIANSHLGESPPESYNSVIPTYLPLRGRIRAAPDITPPALPPQLNKVLLNTRTILGQDVHVLPVPNNSSLNHLYACSIKDGVMATATTTRFRNKVH